MSNYIKGRNLLVFLGGVAIAANKGCSISIEADVKEKASSTSANYKEYVVGRKDWSISTTHLVTHGILLSSEELVGKKVSLSFAFSENEVRTAREHTEDGASIIGDAIITSCRIDAQHNGLATGAFAFKGTGPLRTNNNYTYFVPQGNAALITRGNEDPMIIRKYND